MTKSLGLSAEAVQTAITDHLNVINAAHALGCSEASMRRYMIRYGVANPGDAFDRLRQSVSLTPYQREMIVGMLLGDATIPRLRVERGEANYCLTFSHSLKQLAYAQWKASLLYPLDRPLIHGKASRRWDEEKRHAVVKFSSMCHPDFAPFRTLFYPNGTKIVPPNITELLTLPAIALWYMDDGTLWRWHTGRGYYCVFASQSFSQEDQDLLRAALAHYCAVAPRFMRGSHYAVGGSGVQIYLSRPDSDRFAEAIRPHVHPSMLYKLP